MICLIAAMVGTALQWEFSAKLVPFAIGALALIAAGLSLFNDMCRKTGIAPREPDGSRHTRGRAADRRSRSEDAYGFASDTLDLPTKVIIQRAIRFFGYLIAIVGVMAVIGLIPTVAVFVFFFMRYENQERWSLIIPYTVVLLVSITFIFDYVMSLPWPPTISAACFPR
jgi:small-conductance mechanosensitive channel